MDFNNLNDIDLSTKEGKALFCALTILTVSPELEILGRKVNGRQTEPDVMLQKIEAAAREIWPDWYGEAAAIQNEA